MSQQYRFNTSKCISFSINKEIGQLNYVKTNEIDKKTSFFNSAVKSCSHSQRSIKGYSLLKLSLCLSTIEVLKTFIFGISLHWDKSHYLHLFIFVNIFRHSSNLLKRTSPFYIRCRVFDMLFLSCKFYTATRLQTEYNPFNSPYVHPF